MFGHILLKQRTAEENDTQDGNDIPFQTIAQKGELVAEILTKDQIPRKYGTPSHNYCLYNDPAISLYDDGTGVCPLQGAELDYLKAIQNPTTRIVQYLDADKMKWIIDLKTNDIVFIRLKIAKSAPPLVVKGRVRYYGLVKGCIGVMFGVEIMDPQHKGKGNSDGSPHFHCGHNNAVYVAMDQIVKVTQKIPPTKKTSNSDPTEQEHIIDTQPGHSGPVGSTRSKTADKGEKDKGFIAAAKNKVKGVVEVFQIPGPPMVKPVSSATVHSKFIIGDHVVLQPVDSAPIKGIVRWVGPVRTSKETGGIVIPAVGVETDTTFDHERSFPGLSFGVTGSHGHDLFQVSPHHGRIFLAEQVVLSDEEYLQQKKQDNTEETKEAKKWGVSVEELKRQEELLSKGNKERDKVHEHKRETLPTTTKQEEEEITTGGRGERRGSEDLLSQHKEKTPIGPEGTLNLGEESIRDQQLAYERLTNQFKRQKSHENESSEGHRSLRDTNQPSNSHHDNGQHQSLGERQPSPRFGHQDPTQGIQSQLVVKGNDHHSHSSDNSSRNSPSSVARQSPTNIDNYNRQQHPSNQPVANSNQFQPDDANPRHPSIPSDPCLFTVNTMVDVQMMNHSPLHGIIRWMGTLPNHDGYYAGVELDNQLARCTDGSFEGLHYFTCPPGTGFFCLVSALQLDQRYMEPNQIPAAKRQDMTNPFDKNPQYDDSDTPGGPELFSRYIGDEHGIQGHHNSCYLDATVFGLFALSDSFDMMLLEEPQIDIGRKIKHILWKGIVNPLRRFGLARFESIMELRNELENLGRMKGANKDEKDPEEFLNLLFKEILDVEPFISIKRPFGVEKEFFVQLFLEIEPNQAAPPTTEKLIRKMFHEQNISFTAVPSKLLLQMPRFGKDFKMFNKIIPSLEMDVWPVIDPTSGGVQQCKVCLDMTGTVCCSDCTNVFRTEDTCVFLCKDCSDRIHKNRKEHKFEEVQTKRLMGDASSISKMQLLSVICIETSHYVCFTRTKDKWLFHDSMANRVYDMYNIPRVTEVSGELNHWVYNPDNHQKLLQTPSREIPECVRRFTQDIYMCVYVNPDLERYCPPPDESMPNSPDDNFQIVDMPPKNETEHLTKYHTQV